MKRTVMAVATTLGAVCMLGATSAHAQEYREEFGRRGQFILGADRLMSLFTWTHDSLSQENNGVKTTFSNDQQSMSFFYGYNPPGTDPAFNGVIPQRFFYSVPRVGFDYTVWNNISLGGELILFFTLGGNSKVKTEGNNVTNEQSTGSPSTTVFGIAPRGGYIFHFTNLFSLWARGGFSFYTGTEKQKTTDPNLNATTTTTENAHVFTLDLDPQFIFTPIPHVGLTAGLTFDIPLGGGFSNESDTVVGNTTNVTKVTGNATAFYFGVTLGMLVHF
jgi:hypothetical protein